MQDEVEKIAVLKLTNLVEDPAQYLYDWHKLKYIAVMGKLQYIVKLAHCEETGYTMEELKTYGTMKK